MQKCVGSELCLSLSLWTVYFYISSPISRGAFWYVSLCNTTVLCSLRALQYLSHLCVCPSVITQTCVGMQMSVCAENVNIPVSVTVKLVIYTVQKTGL